jgi:hypothetical protein
MRELKKADIFAGPKPLLSFYSSNENYFTEEKMAKNGIKL